MTKTITVESKFVVRPYQMPIWKAFHKGYKRLVIVAPRRMGKDVLALNCSLEAALQRVGTYLYVLPTYEQARAVVWNCIMSNGQKMIDFIDPALIDSKNEQQMRIKLVNGSVIKLVGSDNYNNSIVGQNAAGMVFSEFALQDPNAWKFASPILAESNGWAMFISTVRGKNHLFDLYEYALENPKTWFALKLTYDETQHLSQENWEEEQRSKSWDFIQQEYYCNWNLGIEGTIYGKYIDKMRMNGQIGTVPFQPKYRVNTAFDIGNDTTAIIYWQIVGQCVNIINYHEDKNKNLEHYIKLVEETGYKNGYLWGKHYFPHDMKVVDWSGPRFTRVFKAQQMGLQNVIVVEKVLLEDGIEWVRSSLPKVYIDEKNCGQLIKCLENYRFELNVDNQIYSKKPVHNWASHGASAMMYMCLAVPSAGIETTPEELKARYQRAMNGGNQFINPIDAAFNKW